MLRISPPNKPPAELAIEINVAALKRVKSLLGVDLTDLTAGDPPLIARLTLDEILICDVLYCVCKPQLDAAGISDEEFGQAMGGETFGKGADLLLEGITDFFQKSGRTEKAAMLRAQRTATLKAVELGTKQIESIDPIQLLSVSGDGFMNSPESSDSVPTVTPSASLSGWPTEGGVTSGTVSA